MKYAVAARPIAYVPEPATRPQTTLPQPGKNFRIARAPSRKTIAAPDGSQFSAGRSKATDSTLIKALLGLVPIQSGEILWNGRPVTDPASFMVPPRCAYTAQAPRLFSESLRDNLLMGLDDDAAAVARAVALAILEEDLAVMEQGLETIVGTRGVTLLVT